MSILKHKGILSHKGILAHKGILYANGLLPPPDGFSDYYQWVFTGKSSEIVSDGAGGWEFPNFGTGDVPLGVKDEQVATFVGTETILHPIFAWFGIDESEGTSTASISDAIMSFTAGVLSYLKLLNGEEYYFNAGNGIKIYPLNGIAEPNWIVVEANETKTITPSFDFDDSKIMRVVKPDGSVVTSDNMSFAVNKGDILYFLDNSADGGEIKTVNFSNDNIILNLSSVSNVTYALFLTNCSLITGDLSSVSNITYYLSLSNCTLITGDLSSVSNLTYYLSLYNCTSMTGDLSSVSNVTNTLNLYNCNILTYNKQGAFQTTNIYWYRTDDSIDLQSMYDLIDDLVLTGKTNGVLNIGGGNKDIVDASALANIATLVSSGWTVTYNS